MKQRCPKCGKLYSDLAMHLVLVHDVKDLSELTQKADDNSKEDTTETVWKEEATQVEQKQAEYGNPEASIENLKRMALLAIIKLRNEKREDHRLELMKTLLTAMSRLENEASVMMINDSLKTAARKTSKKIADALIDYIDNHVGVESPRIAEIRTILIKSQ